MEIIKNNGEEVLRMNGKNIVGASFLSELDMNNEVDRELFLLIKKLILKEQERLI